MWLFYAHITRNSSEHSWGLWRDLHSESGEPKDMGDDDDDDDDDDDNDLTRMIRNVLEIIDWLNQSQI